MVKSKEKSKINVLVLGKGGREHAIAFKLKISPCVEKVYLCPGNGGTSIEYSPGNGGRQLEYENVDLPIKPPFEEIIQLVNKNKITLVIIGSENYLSLGIVDILTQAGIKAFGPTKKASQLETSKIFAKRIMSEATIPTTKYKTFTNIDQAQKYISEKKEKFVLKADGLCEGKGVIIPHNKQETEQALQKYFVNKKFGKSGEKILIEDYMEGQEVSVLAFSDGKTVRLLPPSQDYKRIDDNDQGLNTGGMGNYSPLKFLKAKHLKRIKKNILIPTIRTMAKRGYPFKGILYAGLIINQDDIKVLEFNVRFGDPECQCVLPLLDCDLAEICLACIDGNLEKVNFKVRKNSACTVVVASKGYPVNYQTEKPIHGLNNINRGLIFHAGTKIKNGELVTAGGRVLSISCYADSLKKAIEKCYREVKKVKFSGIHFRKDIGKKGI